MSIPTRMSQQQSKKTKRQGKRKPLAMLCNFALLALATAGAGLVDAKPERVPRAPSLTATGGEMVVELSWTQPQSKGSPIEAFNIYRGTSSGSLSFMKSVDASPRTYADHDVKAGTAYFYQVSAVNAAGEGPPSSTASATPKEPATQTPVPPPPPPSEDTRGTVVFTFDDGFVSHLEAAAILEKHKMRGTFFAISGMMRDGPYYTDFMSAAELAELSAKGHDIQSHTVTHRDLTVLSSAERQTELSQSKSAIEKITGKPVNHVAYPFGAHDAATRTATGEHYATGRGVTNDVEESRWLTDPYQKPGIVIYRTTTVSDAKAYVDFAKTHDVTVILVFHRITDSPQAYDWTPSKLDELAAYAASQPVRVTTMTEAA